jgi:putative ABC transport system permease protein
MKIADIIRDANANLLRSKTRTFLTISAVFIGAFTLALTNGAGDGIKHYINDQLGNAGASNIMYILPKDEDQKLKDSNGGLSEYNTARQQNSTRVNGPSGSSLLVEDDIAKIVKVEGVQEVFRTYTMTPEYMTAGGKKFNVSLDQFIEGTNLKMDAGRVVNNASENDITVPKGYLKPLGLPEDPAQAIGRTISFSFRNSKGELFERKGTIVGVQSKTLLGSTTINASTRFAKAVSGLQQDSFVQSNPKYVFLMVRFDDTKNAQYVSDLKSRLDTAGYTAKTFKDQLGTVSTVINSILIGLNLFGAIALLAATFGIVNTLYIAVQERTREIGLMKALGMKKSRIFMLFSLEAVLIGFWGSVLGVLSANGVGIVVNNIATKSFLKDFEGFNLLAFPWRSKLLVIGIILLISFLAGSLPARKASRKDPIEALRYE